MNKGQILEQNDLKQSMDLWTKYATDVVLYNYICAVFQLGVPFRNDSLLQ